MCGRYIFANDENEFIRKLIEQAEKKMKPRQFEKLSLFDVYPSATALVLIAGTNTPYRIEPMKWGYAGRNGKLIINARSETAFQNGSFFSGSSPCAIPASAYYEWSENHHKYSFRIEEPFFLGGLFRIENGEPVFVILTEEASFPQNEIHNRQPLLFTSEKAKAWIASQQPALLVKDSVSERIIEKC